MAIRTYQITLSLSEGECDALMDAIETELEADYESMTGGKAAWLIWMRDLALVKRALEAAWGKKC